MPAVGVPVLMWVGLIALRLVRYYRAPYLRATLRAYQGDHEGAIAAVREEMARLEVARPTPDLNAPPPVQADPWAPPQTTGIDPHHRARADGWHALSVIEADRKNWPEALRLVEQAEQTDSANSAVYQASRASALVELGRADEAMPLLRASLASPIAANQWARSIFLIGLAKALIATDRASEAGPVLDEAYRLGRWTLVFPRSTKKKWRDRIDELRTRAASGPAKPG